MILSVSDYNAMDGEVCPFCESTNIHPYRPDVDDTIIYRDHKCNSCSQCWTEYFTVTEIVRFDGT